MDLECGPPADGGQARHRAGRHDGFAYLLVQLGTHAARLFAARLAPLGLEPRHAGMLVRLAANEGRSQQAIGELIGLSPTRMVFLVDELEERGLVERRRSPADRRSHALYLTTAGRELLGELGQVVGAHQEHLGASLSPAERGQLTALLRKLAREQGITEQSLPGSAPTQPSAPARPPRRPDADDQTPQFHEHGRASGIIPDARP